MADTSTLAALFDRDHSDRAASLEIARHCAQLTKPWVLPTEAFNASNLTPQNFQSLGARGMTNLEGTMLSALFPTNLPWFKFCLKPAIEYSLEITPNRLQEYYQQLFVRELLIQSIIESAGVTPNGAQTPASFRTSKRRAISQLLITGDVLEYLDDDYRLHAFRRDHYVTRRDGAGEWLYSITSQQIDPLKKLTRKQIEKSGLKFDDLKKKSPAERMQRLVTRVEFQPLTKKWLIEQEVNKAVVIESQETVNPYFSTPYDLTGGEDYGRGFVELNRGDLTSYDAITEKALDFVAAASKITPAISETSEVKESDLQKRSGEPIRARVEGGQIMDISFLRVDKMQDISSVIQIRNEIGRDLARAMLIQSESVRDSERTTKFEVQATTVKEAAAATAGASASISDCQQSPFLHRVIFQVTRDKLMAPLPKDAIDVQVLTGLAAFAKSARAQSIMGIAQAAQALGPEAIAKINGGVLIDVLARYEGIYEPGIIKTNQQIEAEKQSALAQQTALIAAQEGAKAGGQIAVNNAQALTPR